MDVAPWLRVDLVGEFGAHFERLSAGLDLLGVHRDIIGGRRDAALPYAGVRVSPTLLVKGRDRRVLLGPWLSWQRDLSDEQLTYVVRSCGGLFSSDTCSDREHTTSVGGTRLAVGVRLGIELGPPQ